MIRSNSAAGPERPLILCADDDDALLAMLAGLLDMAGYRTVLAHNGREALALFSRHVHELSAAILDLRMPLMNGIEVAHQIRKRSADMPLIALSAYVGRYESGDTLAQCQNAGFSAVMSKPFLVDPFLKALSEWVPSSPPQTRH